MTSKLEVNWKGMNMSFKKYMFISLWPMVWNTEKGNIYLRRNKQINKTLLVVMQKGAGQGQVHATSCLARSETSAFPVKGLMIPTPFWVFLTGCSQVLTTWAWSILCLQKACLLSLLNQLGIKNISFILMRKQGTNELQPLNISCHLQQMYVLNSCIVCLPWSIYEMCFLYHRHTSRLWPPTL